MDFKGIWDFVSMCSVITCPRAPFIKDLVCMRERQIGSCITCCKVDNARDILFQLYTPNNPTTPDTLAVGQPRVLRASHFDDKLPTVFYIHGFTEIYEGLSGQGMKEAYIKRGGYNVILVDWHKLAAGPWYISAADNVKAVGDYVAEFVAFLGQNGVPLASIHLIGFSLGAEVAGFAGKRLDGRLSRITGLDPALPAFRKNDHRTHLSPSDAAFVDVIHTNGGLLGYSTPLGHVDFYPDGGSFHEGCLLMIDVACQHHRSWRYYAESVNNECGFKANKCDTRAMAINEKCNGVVGYLGFAAKKFNTTQGQYFLKTKGKSPFANNQDGCPTPS